MDNATSVWNSLEVVKVAVGVATPIVMIWLGYMVNRLSQQFQSLQWANQKLIEKRIVIYDDAAPLLNDLYCYFMLVGNWKELSPVTMIEHKRRLDKIFYVYGPLFSSDLITVYNAFIHTLFETYSAANHDAKLRTMISNPSGDDRAKSFGAKWNPAWKKYFAAEAEVAETSAIRNHYNDIMQQLALELSIGLRAKGANEYAKA